MHHNLIKTFFERYPAITYKRGEKILRPNEYSGHVYSVMEGYIRVYRILKSGQEISYSFYNPKKQKYIVFGYSPEIDKIYVEAFTEVVLRRSPGVEFEKFLNENPAARDYIAKTLYSFFVEATEQVTWLAIPDAYTRIKYVIHSLAKRVGYSENKKLILDNKTNLEMKITHNLIASFSGLSRETVTIQINRLIAEGYISRRKNSLIIDNLEGLIADIL